MRRLVLALLLLGCGSDPAGPLPGDASVAPLDAVAGGSCAVTVAMPPYEGHDHAPQTREMPCPTVTYQSNPPASGKHYGTWPVFRVYDQPVPWGYLVHGLEHGAVVIVHNCPGGCPDQLAALRAMVEATPTKPLCSRPPIIVAPDPTLDVPFAASAWGHTLRAQCFDRDRFAAFVQSHANMGRENFPDDCGAFDGEAAGWCRSAL